MWIVNLRGCCNGLSIMTLKAENKVRGMVAFHISHFVTERVMQGDDLDNPGPVESEKAGERGRPNPPL